MGAAQEGRLEVLRLLLACGADIDAVCPLDGATAFHIACFGNHPDCAGAGSRGRRGVTWPDPPGPLRLTIQKEERQSPMICLRCLLIVPRSCPSARPVDSTILFLTL
jgi:hypothetical protein